MYGMNAPVGQPVLDPPEERAFDPGRDEERLDPGVLADRYRPVPRDPHVLKYRVELGRPQRGRLPLARGEEGGDDVLGEDRRRRSERIDERRFHRFKFHLKPPG